MAMGAAAVRVAAADAVVTFLWVLCASALGATTAVVTSLLGLAQEEGGGGGHYALLVTASLLGALLFAFDLICGALGGASFNPTDFAASYAAGLDSPSIFSVALRFPAQVRSASIPLPLRPPSGIRSNRVEF
jgi:aquaporin SIP